MGKRFFGFIIFVMVMSFRAPGAQILWDQDGVQLRQGKHIEWYRSADGDSAGYMYVTWSDCRTGTRDIYAQKYDVDGNALWTAEGVHVIEAEGRQEDPVIIADGAGGAVIAWVDVVADPKCRVYCQRLDSEGNRLWPSEGVILNENISTYSPVNITSDGYGGAIVTWKDARNAVDGDIYAIRVTSEGSIASGWPSNGMAVCTQPAEQSGTSIGADGFGGAFITWKDKRKGTDYDIYVQRVTNNGLAQFENGGLLVCGSAGDQDQVKLWGDGNDGVFVVWRDRRNGSYTDIYAQRVTASGQVQWTPGGAILCGADGNQEEPRLVNDGSDGAICTWKDHRNNPYDWDIYAQRVNTTGMTLWGSDGVAVCTAAGDQIEVRLTRVDVGEVCLVWVDQRSEGSPLGDIYVQRLNGDGLVQWSVDGEPICEAAGSQFSPLLRHDAAGGVFALWGDQRTGSVEIYAQRLDPTGAVQWETTGFVVIAGISGNASHLNVMSDTDGAIIVWEDGRRGSLGTYVFAQKVDREGLVSWGDNGIGVDTTGDGSQTAPVVVSDGSGGSLIAWEDRRDGIMQIYAQRLNGDGIPQWPNAVRISPTESDQNDPSITSDGNSGALIAWSDFRGGWDSDVYVQKVNAQGDVAWGLESVLITQSEDDDYAYGIVEDGEGGGIILWQGGSWDDKNLYIQRLDGGGTVPSEWPEGGLALCVSPGNQLEPVLVSDGGGGAICVWEDLRHGAKDIYAQNVNNSGMKLWRVSGEDSLNGLPVCRAENDQSSPSVAVGEDSYCFIAWHDFRDIERGNDIYCQRLSSTGDPMWAEDGINVCSAEGDQSSPVLLGGIDDGALVAWEDYRSSESMLDIFAQKMDESGNVQWEHNGTCVCLYAQKQTLPKIVGDGQGGAFIVWEDMRSKGKADTHDIYAQRLSGLGSRERGDVNGDGGVDVLDVLATVNHILGIQALEGDALWLANCNGDADIDVLDVLGIVNVILGVGTCAP
ncbi:MAG: dockerin type I repeat-containing protein [Gemmatimonadota bacterium]|nr:MAG: dockerin type I repeat-containing protein [Gemmatimonadota bacterium]